MAARDWSHVKWRTVPLRDRPPCPCGNIWRLLYCNDRPVTVRCVAGHQPRDWSDPPTVSEKLPRPLGKSRK